jgi:hypothetical protein
MASPLTLQGSGVTDIYIGSLAPTNNFSGDTIFYIGEDNTTANTLRTMIKFDLSSIPAGSIIDSAVMTFYMSTGDYSDNARTLSVYRLLRSVDFATCTWNVYSTGNNWGTAGCSNTTSDREATDICDGPTQPNPPVENDPIVFNLTASKIQEMITGGVFTNNGFIVQVATENNDCITYKNTSNATAGVRPKLVVNYHAPSGFFALL